MIWRLLVAAATVAAVIGWAAAARRDPGYLLLHWGPWSLESTLSLAVAAAAAAFVAFHLALRLGGGLFRLPARLGAFRRLRRAAAARAALTEAVRAAAEGRWEAAEKEAMRTASRSDVAPLHHLTAAYAAHRRGDVEGRDRHLHVAMETLPATENALALIQAQWQLENDQPSAALATLRRVRERAPRLPRLDELQARAHLALEEWGALRELLPTLEGRLPAEHYRKMERATFLGLMEQDDAEGLRTLWRSLPERLRDDDEVVARYAERLMATEAAVDVESFLREALAREWREPLVALYGELEGPDPAAQMGRVERWLAERPKDAALLLTAGRLALRNRLWGNARGYLEAAVAIRPTLKGYRLLARTLEEVGDLDALAACRRDALERI